jgi:hypothetical protein
MTYKINGYTKYIRTFLQALSLYFHYDEWNVGTVMLRNGASQPIYFEILRYRSE